MTSLFKKYDVPAPRYTSYPTVPYWTDSPRTEEWLQFLHRGLSTPNSSWSMYIHIPYCETLCTFCGCNNVITRNHEKENPYIKNLLQEWKLYADKENLLTKRPLKHLHLGGGTPTFLSTMSLETLLSPILERMNIDKEQFEASLEADPRRTSEDQLKALYDLGFRRISLGIQDFNESVQSLINRVQPFEQTAQITQEARRIGYSSINFDLIYGLPQQSLQKIKRTIELTLELRPERIALYSLAVVPWIKPAQRLFKDEDLPQGEKKRKLYELSRELLLSTGYIDVGMDHFALPHDNLAKASKKGVLHRNFMGYTDMRTDVMLGMGVSAISESSQCYHQNEKILPVYERLISEGQIPTLRGHKLTEEEQRHREQIMQFMSQGYVNFKNCDRLDLVKARLEEMLSDQLVEINGTELKTTAKGQPFLRNACMALDERLAKNSPEQKVFSKTL